MLLYTLDSGLSRSFGTNQSMARKYKQNATHLETNKLTLAQCSIMCKCRLNPKWKQNRKYQHLKPIQGNNREAEEDGTLGIGLLLMKDANHIEFDTVH